MCVLQSECIAKCACAYLDERNRGGRHDVVIALARGENAGVVQLGGVFDGSHNGAANGV
jgi:hypothetical protein